MMGSNSRKVVIKVGALHGGSDWPRGDLCQGGIMQGGVHGLAMEGAESHDDPMPVTHVGVGGGEAMLLMIGGEVPVSRGEWEEVSRQIGVPCSMVSERSEAGFTGVLRLTPTPRPTHPPLAHSSQLSKH